MSFNFSNILSKLRINGSDLEEKEFQKKIKSYFQKLEPKHLEVLEDLYNHHASTIRHSIFVAYDTEYIARKLGFPEDEVHDLVVAALLHDVGKLFIHTIILDLGNNLEMQKIWDSERYPKEGDIPNDKNLFEILKVRDVIKYKAKENPNWFSYMRNYLKWLNDKNLKQFLKLPLIEYMHYHQKGTEIILKELGLSEKIVKLAASHHPHYFLGDKKDIPEEARIIEVADRFNALIQSEGERPYLKENTVNKKVRVEALLDLTKSLDKFYIKGLRKSALTILVEKYLIEDIKSQLIPDAQKFLENLESKKYNKISTLLNLSKILNMFTIIITLSKKYDNIFENDKKTRNENLKFDLERLKQNLEILEIQLKNDKILKIDNNTIEKEIYKVKEKLKDID